VIPGIDLHSVCIPEPYLRLLEREGPRFGIDATPGPDGTWTMRPHRERTVYGDRPIAVSRAHWDAETRLEEMRRTGTATQVLSVPTTLFNYGLPAAQGRELAAVVNDSFLELAGRHPTRFAAFATVPLQDARAAAEELARVAAAGAVGVEIGSSVGELELDDPSLTEFWEAAEHLGMPVFIHGHDVPGGARLGRWFMVASLGIPVATALAYCALAYGGVLERFSRLRVLLAHGGGVYPYLRARHDHVYGATPQAREDAPEPPGAYLRNVYADSIVFGEDALRLLVAQIGIDRIVLGSDYPFAVGQLDGAAWIRGLPWLSEEDKERILFRNAVGLLGLDDPTLPETGAAADAAGARTAGEE
jgi:aminocarboxymuconate-semialdehyde decarboxylase